MGTALYESPEIPVHVRLAEHDGAIYLDLANKAWEAVKITPDGWVVVPYPPVKFLRLRGIESLPHPVRGGSVDELRRFVNVGDDQRWVLLVSFLIAALRPTGPYPVLVLEGTQGSAKSTLTRVVRALVDPNSAPLRAEPRDARDLMISASNSWCLAFDNISKVPPWFADALCRLSTGGGLGTRELYFDRSEILFDATRPAILNGIDTNITRGDLVDRSLFITVPGIADGYRMTEKQFWEEFEEARPRIFGALLDAVVCSLQRLPEVKLLNLPRMADFAVWVTAAEPSLGWPTGTFLRAYRGNRQEWNKLALEGSIVFPAIEKLVEYNPWQGTPSELLKELHDCVDDSVSHQREWPKDARTLSATLRRLTPNLQAAGFGVQFSKSAGSNSRRVVSIGKLGGSTSPRESTGDSAN